MLNTIHVQTFLAVVEAGSYSAAAERLHMSQPAISQHIRALEAQFEGVRLFRRVGQRMVLTHAGEELVDLAREMVVLSERAEEQLRALRGQVSGRVVIGCTPSSGEQIFPPLLAAFRAKFPAINLGIQQAPPETLLEWLANQEVHILLTEEPQRRRGWESHFLGSERLVLLAPRGHALLQQEQVPAGMLRGVPLVLPRAGMATRRVIEDGLRRRGVSSADLAITLEADGVAMTIQAVRHGLGLAFIPQSRLPRGRDFGVVDLSGAHLQLEWYALRSRERGAPRAIQELFAFITSTDTRRLLAKEGLQPPLEKEVAR
jgi:DNA-binding transcriptional LysR family regulator